ncbi:MAG: hypothetical protein RLZZ628_4365, partial [Bacteroidota bacterium]
HELGRFGDFRVGKVRFVRKVLRAGIL